MASTNLLLRQLIFSVIVLAYNSANAQLKVGFYKETCPQAEAVVKKVVNQVISEVPSIGAPLLRIHFHDCFVRGCDGSVLLNSPTQQAEKDSVPNQSIRGFQTIDRVKSALEEECPGVVSCADILAIVARDVVVSNKGPYWEVETGRRDGSVSKVSEVNLPSPFANISTLVADFLAVGLSVKDLVVLSGAHTIGTSHCSSFSNRLYNFTGNGLTDVDVSLDSEYITQLRSRCSPQDTTTLVEMDPGSRKTFDTSYYELVSKRRGLLQSDSALLDHSETRAYVELQADPGKTSSFFQDFAESMVRMGRIGVVTGSSGQVRKVCYRVD